MRNINKKIGREILSQIFGELQREIDLDITDKIRGNFRDEINSPFGFQIFIQLSKEVWKINLKELRL